ncbi:stalk domain-containing protein [Cohnella boryungensis]|uniref:Stalk domain-containing protein n=1 Tax=Cohnella boryungensis TaxID=768479 RepID=A0ABV8S586_9BACL
MKRLAILLFSAMLTFALAGAASAAASKPQAMAIQVDGKAVDFGADLLITKNKAYVEYAKLFKQLGYESYMEEATKTIYAENGDFEIQATVGGDLAFVNGLTAASTGELISRDGKTWIGLRFASLLMNYGVEWEADTKTAVLVFQGPTQADKDAIKAMFDKLRLVEASGDVEGLASFMAKDTVLDVKALQENFKSIKAKTQSTMEEMTIQAFNGGKAAVVALEETKKVSGGFFADVKTQARYMLSKDEAGQWKIYNIEVLDIEYTDIPGLFKQQATVPEAEKTAIGNLFAEQVKAANEKNAEAYVATLEDYPEKEELKASLVEMFGRLSLNVTTEQLVIVDYDSSGKATLLVSMLTETEIAGQKYKNRTVVVNDAVKTNGKWLLKAETGVLSNENL